MAQGDDGATLTVEERHGQQVGVERLVFFSDAVFAIAITLLVLDIKLPHDAPSLDYALAATAPRIFAFLLSFMVIGIYWLIHHRLFAVVGAASPALLRVNLLHLLCVSFLPFPTSVVAEHGTEASAVILYALSVAALGLTSFVLIAVATRPPCVVQGMTMMQRRTMLWRSSAPPVIFVASAFVAPAYPAAAIFSWLLVPAALVLMTRLPKLLYRRTETVEGPK